MTIDDGEHFFLDVPSLGRCGAIDDERLDTFDHDAAAELHGGRPAVLDRDGLEVHADHAGGVAAHRTDVRLMEADGHAGLRDHHDLVVAVGQLGRDEAVAVLDVDADDAALAVVGVLGDLGLLDGPVGRPHHEEAALVEVRDADHRGQLLVLLEVEQAGDRLAARGAGGLLDLVDLLHVDPAVVHEEQDVVVGVGGEQVLDEVAVLVGRGLGELRALGPLAAALLQAVLGDGGALDEAGVGDGDHAALVGHDVLGIGDTLTEDKAIAYDEIPRFPPEVFTCVAICPPKYPNFGPILCRSVRLSSSESPIPRRCGADRRWSARSARSGRPGTAEAPRLPTRASPDAPSRYPWRTCWPMIPAVPASRSVS